MLSDGRLWFYGLFVWALVPLFIWYANTGSLLPYLTGQYPPGQLAYVLSKLCGLYALVAINFQILLVLLNRLVLPGIGRFHAPLGAAIALGAIAHYVLFIVAVSQRQDSFAIDLLFLNFKDFYHFYLSVGLISFYLLLFTISAGLWRKYGGKKFGRWLHRTYYLLITGVYLHCLAVGSEVQGAPLTIYLFSHGILCLCLFLAVIGRARAVNRAID